MAKPCCMRWAFDLSCWTPTIAQLMRAMNAVQIEERTRLMKFYFIDDFLSSLVGRLLMRKFISNYSGLDYYKIRFARDIHGKPYWCNKELAEQTNGLHLNFNVSHQGDFVVLAGLVVENTKNTCDFGIGVDIMKIEYTGGRSLNGFFRLMHKKFSEEEWLYITRTTHTDRERLKAFMRHWCLKESYVKELGVGITVDLQKISFSVGAFKELKVESEPLTDTKLTCNGVPMSNWYFEEHLLQPEYCVAIAFKNCKPASGKFFTLNIDELIDSSNEIENHSELLEYCKKVIEKPRKKD